MPRQQFGVALADVTDAEPVDQAMQLDAAAGIDRAEQIAHRGLAITLALHQLAGRTGVALLQREDVDRRHHQTVFVKLLDLLVAEAVDIERQPRDEMLQPLRRLRRADQRAGAAAHRLVLLAHRMAAAHRTGVRKFVRFCAFRPLVQDNADHLRDHVAGALHHDGIADTKIDAVADRVAVVADALDVILIMQRRVRDHDAADGDRL